MLSACFIVYGSFPRAVRRALFHFSLFTCPRHGAGAGDHRSPLRQAAVRVFRQERFRVGTTIGRPLRGTRVSRNPPCADLCLLP